MSQIKTEPMETSMDDHEQEVRDLFKIFYKNFDRHFEQLLKHYCRKIKKESKQNPTQELEDGIGQITGALAKTVLEPTKVVDKAIPALIKIVRATFKISEKRFLKDILPLVENSSVGDDTKKIFAEACFEIFKNYEMLFANISAKGNRHAAMLILAQEAVEAVINYFVVRDSLPELSEALILEAIQQINHKKTKNIFLRTLENMYAEIKTTVTFSDIILNIKGQKDDLYPIKIYSKAGVIENGRYYKKPQEKSNTEKYGYRLKFNFETIESYQEENNLFHIDNYRFILKEYNKQKFIKEFLKELQTDSMTTVRKIDPNKPLNIHSPSRPVVPTTSTAGASVPTVQPALPTSAAVGASFNPVNPIIITPSAPSFSQYYDQVNQLGFEEIKLENLEERWEREMKELKIECQKWGKQLVSIDKNEIEDWDFKLTQKATAADSEVNIRGNKIKGWKFELNQGF